MGKAALYMIDMSESAWLAPFEQEELIDLLVEWGIIKWDNKRSLPLKSGGKTDIYINLRDARSRPEALRFVSGLYASAFSRLRIERFFEIPDAVSCFAPLISTQLGIPYVTIREQAKVGRVSKATAIGASNRGERGIIFDDVVNDGASKIAPYRECVKMGINLGPMVVLVDRQQGWKKIFAENGVTLPVWAGMRLHTVRKRLIEKEIMSRCDPEIEEKNPIILALDGKSWEDVLPLVDVLRTTGCILKVNDLLFWEGYKSLVPDLAVYGRVMVDLKGHDIPNTLGNISARFAKNPPWAITVHASGGMLMIKEVVDKFAGTPTKILAVTVLTSMDEKTCEEIYHRRPVKQVLQLAAIAARGGAHGFVCSPEEVGMLRPLYPNMLLVTPGVRSPGADKGDQKRVATIEEALSRGATHIVGGRQFLGAADPVAEVKRVLTEEIKISV